MSDVAAATQSGASFAGRVAIVTGAAGGIGSAVVARLAAEGCAIAAVDIRDPAEAGTAAALSIVADVTNEAAVQGATERTLSELGAVDYVVHAAGVILRSPLADTSIEAWRSVVDMNLHGSFVVLRTAANLLAGRAGSAIVTVASLSARVGGTGIGAYAATKGGLETLTRILALELAPAGVRVNAVAPGIIDTPMIAGASGDEHLLEQIPLRRLGLPDEVACAVTFLLSSDATYITGQTLAVDGGLGAR